MSDQLIKTDSFIEQIKRGSTPLLKQDTTVVVEDRDPSAVGGLAALGATVLGATAIGRRIPALKNFFKVAKQKPIIQTIANKPSKVMSDIGEIPTATGQSQSLITTSRELVPVTKSRYGEIKDIPFTQGAGFKKQNPITGSAAYDWVMEAPMEKAPAKDWIKWMMRGNQEHPIPSGPLAGVSRRVTPEELRETNLLSINNNQPVGGFLKFAEDRNLDVSREQLLGMIKNSPLNRVNVLRLGVRGNPVTEIAELMEDVRKNIKEPAGTSIASAWSGARMRLDEDFVNKMGLMLKGKEPVDVEKGQKAISELFSFDKANAPFYSNFLKKYNEVTGKYNAQATRVELDPFNKSQRSYTKTYFPEYRSYKDYYMQGGDNFTEDVIYFKGAVPNTKSGRFKYYGQGPHYVQNEIGFIRYDDLPNPKLGEGKRHLRISELQTDLHSPQFDKGYKKDYFESYKVPFNQDAIIKQLQREKQDLLDQLAPYTELGRGVAGLPKDVQQKIARLNYKISELDRSAVGAFLNRESLADTTAGPLSRSFPDFAIKNVLRNMAERKINAVSIVPSAMNKSIKMPSISKIGDDINYGRMNGKASTLKDGKIVESKELATNVNVLKKIARQYGAKFEMFQMPKSDPTKRFKVIQVFKSGRLGGEDYEDMVKQGRAHYNRKDDDGFVFDDHIAAFNSEEEAKKFVQIAGRKDMISERSYSTKVVEMSPDDPRNYEIVPTLIADDQVLQKFLLPMKSYMRTGGLVDKNNVFKSLI